MSSSLYPVHVPTSFFQKEQCSFHTEILVLAPGEFVSSHFITVSASLWRPISPVSEESVCDRKCLPATFAQDC